MVGLVKIRYVIKVGVPYFYVAVGLVDMPEDVDCWFDFLHGL